MLTVASDLTVLFLALPTLRAQLDPSASQALWIVHSYGFLVAGFLFTMGRLADRTGPRRLLVRGGTAFAALSVFAAFSVSAEMLIVVRALLGVAGAYRLSLRDAMPGTVPESATDSALDSIHGGLRTAVVLGDDGLVAGVLSGPARRPGLGERARRRVLLTVGVRAVPSAGRRTVSCGSPPAAA